MGFAVVEVQPTPNPNALKFVVNGLVAEQRASFFSAEEAQQHALARRLFTVPGVCGLLLLGDFITVNKLPKANWSVIKRGVRQVLAEA